MARAQKITPFLWFDGNAEEAAKFYTSVFKNSRIKAVTRYPEEAAQAAGRPNGSVMTVSFELDGQEFTALNGGPEGSDQEKSRRAMAAMLQMKKIDIAGLLHAGRFGHAGS